MISVVCEISWCAFFPICDISESLWTCSWSWALQMAFTNLYECDKIQNSRHQGSQGLLANVSHILIQSIHESISNRSAQTKVIQ